MVLTNAIIAYIFHKKHCKLIADARKEPRK